MFGKTLMLGGVVALMDGLTALPIDAIDRARRGSFLDS